MTTAFHRVIAGCASQVNADVAFLDVGPNLGAIITDAAGIPMSAAS